MLVMESCYIYIIKHFLWCLFCGSGLNTARTASSKTWKIKTNVKFIHSLEKYVLQWSVNNISISYVQSCEQFRNGGFDPGRFL